MDTLDLHRGLRTATMSQSLELYRTLDWELVTGPVNAWFNVATHFSSYDLDNEALLICEYGLIEHPSDVDLLCFKFQLEYGVFTHFDIAQALWERLNELEDRKRYWRYWTYGANFKARLSHYEEAIELIEEGLRHVRGTDISNIYRVYADIYIASPPQIQQRFSIEEKLQEGLALRLREGHTIAEKLADVLQRSAHSPKVDERNQTLRLALEATDIALAVAVDLSSNHRPDDIFFTRARILIALKSYAEALPILRALERSDYRRAKTNFVKTLRILCEEILGERPEEPKSPEDSGQKESPSIQDFIEIFQILEPSQLYKILTQIPGGLEKIKLTEKLSKEL